MSRYTKDDQADRKDLKAWIERNAPLVKLAIELIIRIALLFFDTW